jgi:hypothetical protein
MTERQKLVFRGPPPPTDGGGFAGPSLPHARDQAGRTCWRVLALRINNGTVIPSSGAGSNEARHACGLLLGKSARRRGSTVDPARGHATGWACVVARRTDRYDSAVAVAQRVIYGKPRRDQF